MTLVAEMRDPPQKWLPLTWREACHGATFSILVTSSPPTILWSQKAEVAEKYFVKQQTLLGSMQQSFTNCYHQEPCTYHTQTDGKHPRIQTERFSTNFNFFFNITQIFRFYLMLVIIICEIRNKHSLKKMQNRMTVVHVFQRNLSFSYKIFSRHC